MNKMIRDKINRNNKIFTRMFEHLEVVKDEFEWVGLFLQGSQNYNLDYEESDIDTKLIVLPTFENICLNDKSISTTRILENNEHIDIKDIRSMIKCFKKQNINFIEVLFTDYFILNPKYEQIWIEFILHNEEIAHYNNYTAISCMAGMIMEKYKALEHPYPTTKDKIDKYGYDPKQYSHIARVNLFLENYIKGKSYRECLIPNKNEIKDLLEIKKGERSLEEARRESKRLLDLSGNTRTEYMKNNELVINKNVDTYCDNLIVNLMKKNLLEGE